MSHDGSANTTREEGIARIRDLMKDIDICMLTTVDDASGRLRSRPMSLQEAEFDGQLWFFTYEDSGKVAEVQRDRHVNISFADKGKQNYVSVSGNAKTVTDRAKMQEFWNPVLKAWFPEGIDTPGIALLCVEVDQAEYWQSEGRVATVINMAKALITGEEADWGENEKLDLRK